MNTIGLIGGMSWESTAVYYRRINEQMRERLGGLASAEILLRSVNFDAIVRLQQAGEWTKAAALLASHAKGLEQAGADCILICTNTMHKLADEVQAAITIPLLHIADVTGQAVRSKGHKRPLLLATRYTMEQEFYLSRMRNQFGLLPMVPEAADRTIVHNIIFDELCCGVIKPESRIRYLEVIERARVAGADSVILGCTEIGLLIGPDDCDLATFDSTMLHADHAVGFALGQALMNETARSA